MDRNTNIFQLTKALSTKRGRFTYVVLLHFFALIISWLKLSRINFGEGPSFIESAGTSLFIGIMSLPLSAGHFLLNLGDQNIIHVGGRPLLFLTELAVSIAVLAGIIIFIGRGNKFAGWLVTIYMLIAAPYWAYYSFALIGI